MSSKDLILAGEKEQLQAIGHQVKTLLPGGSKLTDNQAISVGNYAELTGANPFRGEIYGYQDKDGDLVLVDGYKLLIRWAKKISDYDETYSERLPSGVEGINDGDIGYRITILRHDKKAMIREYVSLGAKFKEAYDLVANMAVGIVKASETRYPPPKGWSWDGVARKRALKNVLNLAYAMPSIEELRRLSWEVNGTQTIPDDWAEPGIYNTAAEAERHAELAAQERQRQEKLDGMDAQEHRAYNAKIEMATDLMRNNGDDDPLELSSEEPTAEPQEPEVPAELVVYRNELQAEAAKVPNKKVSPKRLALLKDKLAECFSGDNDAAEKGQAILSWLVNDPAELAYGEVQVLLMRMLLKQDPETNDYPLNPTFCEMARKIYHQTKIEAGQY